MKIYYNGDFIKEIEDNSLYIADRIEIDDEYYIVIDMFYNNGVEKADVLEELEYYRYNSICPNECGGWYESGSIDAYYKNNGNIEIKCIICNEKIGEIEREDG